MTKLSEARVKFLTDILCGAVENGGVGWFYVTAYKWENLVDPFTPYATVVEDSDFDDGETYDITFDVIRQGLRVISDAEMRTITTGYDAGEMALHNAKTGQRLYLAPDRRRAIMAANRSNGEDNRGDLDAIDYLAIVECGLFGAVTYA